jgi:uncharacterized membrane protein YqhA
MHSIIALSAIPFLRRQFSSRAAHNDKMMAQTKPTAGSGIK